VTCTKRGIQISGPRKNNLKIRGQRARQGGRGSGGQLFRAGSEKLIRPAKKDHKFDIPENTGYHEKKKKEKREKKEVYIFFLTRRKKKPFHA